MSSVMEQYAKQEAKKAAEKAADTERKEAEARDLNRARKLYATGRFSVDELAEVFEIDAAKILEA